MNNNHKKHKWRHLHITATGHWLPEKITHVKYVRCESVLAVKNKKTLIIPEIISVL